MVNADTNAVQYEQVFPEVPVAYERDDTLLSLFEKQSPESESAQRRFRIATQVRPGGRFRYVSLDNGALGRGGASKYLESYLTPIDMAFAVELSKKVEIATNSKKKALFDVVNRETASGMKQARTALDIAANGPGSGILGLPTIAGTTWTFPTTGPGVSWFYAGQGIELYTSTFATKRAGVAIVQTIDPAASTITVDALPTNGVTGDVAVVEGLTQGAGLAQGLYGLDYHINSANTGTWQNVNRADYPEVRSVEYPAGSAALSYTFGRLLVNKIAKLLGVDFATGQGLIWYGNLEQKHAMEIQAQTSMIVNKSGGASQNYDGSFDIASFVGLRVKFGIHANPRNLYAIKPKTFIRAVQMPLKYYTVPGPGGGSATTFPIYNADGAIEATGIWWLCTSMQLANNLPRANGLISGLGVPAGY